MRQAAGVFCLAAAMLSAASVRAADSGVAGYKLIVIDNVAATGKAKVVLKMKDDPGIQKGADGDPAMIDATLDLFYTDSPCNFARFEMPGASWRDNDGGRAKYLNKQAPAVGGGVKSAQVKNGKIAKVIAKGIGDDGSEVIDLIGGGAPSNSGGITAVLTVRNANDGSAHRMCTRFAVDDGSTILFGDTAGGSGRKLVAKNGVAAPCSEPQGGVLMEVDHASGFFALPWPNDVRRNMNGSLDMAGYPSTATSAIANLIVGLGSAVTFGFGTNSAIFFQSCGALDTATLPAPVDSQTGGATAMLVNLDDPMAPRVPLLADFKAPSTTIRPANLLSLLPYPGYTLEEETRYAVILFDGIAGAGGATVRPAPLLDELDAAWDASRPVNQATWDALRAQRDDVFAYVSANTSWTSDDVVAFTVFTTQDTTGELDAIAAALAALPAPTPVSRTSGTCSMGGDRTTITGEVDLPKWQQGTFPYVSSGGAIVVSGGVAVQQGTERVNFELTLPCGPAPVAGWPILLFMDGTGGSADSDDLDYMGATLSDPPLAYVVASIAPLYSGDRYVSGLPAPYDAEEFLYFNYLNPIAGRTNQIQQASEMVYLRRVVEGLQFTAMETNAGMNVPTDDSLVMVSGHSQGALTVPHILAVDPAVDAGFISAGGGGLFLTVLQRGDIRALLDVAVGAQPGELDMFHPVPHALQALAEVGDAANYAPRVGTQHVLSIGGKKDGCSPLEVVSVIGRGMGLPVANPVYYPMFGTAALEPPTIAFPVSANLAGGRTGVTVQIDSGHFGSITNPTLGRSFADSTALGATAVNPTLPILSDSWFGGCPARYEPLP